MLRRRARTIENDRVDRERPSCAHVHDDATPVWERDAAAAMKAVAMKAHLVVAVTVAVTVEERTNEESTAVDSEEATVEAGSGAERAEAMEVAATVGALAEEMEAEALAEETEVEARTVGAKEVQARAAVERMAARAVVRTVVRAVAKRRQRRRCGIPVVTPIVEHSWSLRVPRQHIIGNGG